MKFNCWICYTPFTRYNRLSKRLYNRFDNRLYRINKHPTGCQTGCQTGDNRVERTAAVRSTGCQTALYTPYNRFDNRLYRVNGALVLLVKSCYVTRMSCSGTTLPAVAAGDPSTQCAADTTKKISILKKCVYFMHTIFCDCLAFFLLKVYVIFLIKTT